MGKMLKAIQIGWGILVAIGLIDITHGLLQLHTGSSPLSFIVECLNITKVLGNIDSSSFFIVILGMSIVLLAKKLQQEAL